MNKFRAFLLIIASFIMMASCEKEVHISLPSSAAQVVVNGFIEQGGPPFVFLSRTISFFATVDLGTLQNSLIHGATISVTDGSTTHILREYSFDSMGHTLSVYAIDTADPTGFTFRGQVGHSYALTVNIGGTLYQSNTTIPATAPVDSLTSALPIITRKKIPTARQLFVYYSDPDTPGNNLRYFTSVNHRAFYPGENSVLDDQVINGAKDVRFPLRTSDGSSGTTTSDSSGFVFPGDTVILKWCGIDRGVYNFYNTLEYSLSTVGNPFSSPINVKSNISNGALGVWAGYGITYDTLIIK